MQQRPYVGVAVIVVKDGKVLLGKRKGAHGEGSWAFPGGHLEFRESLEECALRELTEETGIQVKNIRRGTFTNDIFTKEGKHYVTLFVLADWEAGEPEVREPEKCEGWQWFSWDNLPQPLFLTIQNLIKQRYSPFV